MNNHAGIGAPAPRYIAASDHRAERISSLRETPLSLLQRLASPRSGQEPGTFATSSGHSASRLADPVAGHSEFADAISPERRPPPFKIINRLNSWP